MADNPAFDNSEGISQSKIDEPPVDTVKEQVRDDENNYVNIQGSEKTTIEDETNPTLDTKEPQKTEDGNQETHEDKPKAIPAKANGMENGGFDPEAGSQAPSTISTIDGTRKSMGMTKDEPDGPYAGMGKEAVMEYSNTPFWRTFRWTLLILLVAGWLGLLGASIGIIATSPRCLPWWQTSVIYQIYPRSFYDGNQSIGEGIGDFVGITKKLDYISGLGVGAILLNSIYKSPDKDFGYDVSDLMDVNENFGTMEDFQELVDQAHERGLKVILDFAPNQASVESTLFNFSKRDDKEWKDAFTWENNVPNNWLSVYGNSSWSHDETRDQYYLHQFSTYQPDLNLRNAKVLEYLEDAMDFWFGKGVDGLNIQGTQYLFEDPELRDEPVKDDWTGSSNDYNSLEHDYTVSYDGVHQLLHDWREGIFFRYSTAGTYRVMMTDVNTNATDQGTYYGTNNNPEADLPQNYDLFHIGNVNGEGGTTTGAMIHELVNDWLNKIPGEWPSFQLGNHEVRRITSRLSYSHIKAANMLLLTLPGTPICYYGDEIGMSDTQINTYEDVRDIKGKSDPANWLQLTRDPERGPMQWNDSANSGFSGADPWLPVADNYKSVNVASQDDAENSILGVFRELTSFRSDNRAFLSKDIRLLDQEYADIIAYIRSSGDQEAKFLVMINFGSESLESDVYNFNEGVPLQGEVRLATTDGRVGETVELNKLPLGGAEGLIIQLDG